MAKFQIVLYRWITCFCHKLHLLPFLIRARLAPKHNRFNVRTLLTICHPNTTLPSKVIIVWLQLGASPKRFYEYHIRLFCHSLSLYWPISMSRGIKLVCMHTSSFRFLKKLCNTIKKLVLTSFRLLWINLHKFSGLIYVQLFWEFNLVCIITIINFWGIWTKHFLHLQYLTRWPILLVSSSTYFWQSNLLFWIWGNSPHIHTEK